MASIIVPFFIPFPFFSFLAFSFSLLFPFHFTPLCYYIVVNNSLSHHPIIRLICTRISVNMSLFVHIFLINSFQMLRSLIISFFLLLSISLIQSDSSHPRPHIDTPAFFDRAFVMRFGRSVERVMGRAAISNGSDHSTRVHVSNWSMPPLPSLPPLHLFPFDPLLSHG